MNTELRKSHLQAVVSETVDRVLALREVEKQTSISTHDAINAAIFALPPSLRLHAAKQIADAIVEEKRAERYAIAKTALSGLENAGAESRA